MKTNYFNKKYKPLPKSRPGEINYNFFDIYTIAHFLIGIIYGSIQLSFFIAIVLAIAWELIENPLKTYFPILFPHATADTWKNSLGDIMAVLMGWWIVTSLINLFH